MNAIPASARQRSTAAGGSASFTPSSSSTSAEPHIDETERLPCFATFAPHAAATTDAAVEKLTVWCPSPPVPTMSTHGPTVGLTAIMCRRIAVTIPATSCDVSPLARSATRNAAAWHGSTPAMIDSTPASASAAVRSVREINFSIGSFIVPAIVFGRFASLCANRGW